MFAENGIELHQGDVFKIGQQIIKLKFVKNPVKKTVLKKDDQFN